MCFTLLYCFVILLYNIMVDFDSLSCGKQLYIIHSQASYSFFIVFFWIIFRMKTSLMDLREFYALKEVSSQVILILLLSTSYVLYYLWSISAPKAKGINGPPACFVSN